jgi:hypothetical protein
MTAFHDGVHPSLPYPLADVLGRAEEVIMVSLRINSV